MGHEILYCTRCRTQLRSTDFEKELAYYLEGRAYCETCARDLVHTLPEERINDILHAFESTSDDTPRAPQEPPHDRPRRTNCTTRIIKALVASSGPRMPTNSTRRMVLPGSERMSETTLIAGAAVLVLIFGGLAIIVGSDSPPPPAKPVVTERPAAYVASHEPSPAPEDRVTKKIAAAYEFGRLNPDKLEKQIALFEEAGLEPGASKYSAELDAALRDLRRKATDRRTAALEPVEREYRAALIRTDFRAAGAAIVAARARRLDAEWDRCLDRMNQELESEVARVYQMLRNNAVEARRRGATDEVRRIQDRVAGWNRPDLTRDLETFLGSSAR
jgi:hypothetical protein